MHPSTPWHKGTGTTRRSARSSCELSSGRAVLSSDTFSYVSPEGLRTAPTNSTIIHMPSGSRCHSSTCAATPQGSASCPSMSEKKERNALQILSPYSFTLPHLQVRRALGAAIPCSSCARCWLSPYGISNEPSTYHQRSAAGSHYGLHSSTCDPFPPFQDKNPAQRQRYVWAQQN